MEKLSAILEDHAQQALHPEWAVPAVLEDGGLENLGLCVNQACAARFSSPRPLL